MGRLLGWLFLILFKTYFGPGSFFSPITPSDLPPFSFSHTLALVYVIGNRPPPPSGASPPSVFSPRARGALIPYIAGGRTQKSPARCLEFSFFLILISEDSNSYFEIVLVLSRNQKNYFGPAPFFSPSPGLRPGSGLPAAPRN